MEGRRKKNRFTIKMQKKLVVLFILVLLAFVGLSYRLFIITRDNGERYKKQVLSQQKYDSTSLPYKRGSILDTNGSILASSEKVYNVILDAVAVSQDESYLEPTLEALRTQIGADVSAVRSYIAANSETSRYYVLAKRLEFEQIQGLMGLINEDKSLVKGIWFEEEYKRSYPGGSLACDVIGFTTSDNAGSYGLEEFYNDVLSGTPGREYGYLNGDSNLERTTIPAVDGNSIITTIDINIQSIVEKYLRKFDEEYRDGFHEGNGANNLGCIIMDVNSGEVLAMAGYPVFDLNDTRNLDALIGMPILNEAGERTGEYINEENLSQLTNNNEAMYRQLNALWKNFCISETYEPGSVSKPLTVAAGIESGSITGNERYNCKGVLEIGGHEIHCHNTWGDGELSVSEGIERSCNVNMMYVASATGVETFTEFQHMFNLGLKTNIDLAGEARTASLIYNKNTMHSSELATCSFGQGYNCTMIQMMSAFCSLINGGYYYEPHVVKKIVSPSGATVQNIEPRVLRQTISETTSDRVREMCNLVVSGENGTGKTARPAGYMIGGKTGTAQTVPRSAKEYVLSFLGYAPTDDPQVAIYVVVDRPNVSNAIMDDAKYATRIVRGILTEVLPYMGIYMTEELSEKEIQELNELQIEIMTAPAPGTEEGETAEGEDGETGEGTSEESPEGTGEGEPSAEAEPTPNEPWKDFPIDPETGYAVDPATGNYVDPVTGYMLGVDIEGERSAGETPGIEEPADTPE
ncbi:MAG: penicillin-binding transpeptidase domain-containing protein [Lachnospiraceae bacterium]|nr:penicillin-binding transpeptidase domain-containing protein [Lachnospiraceae bacterium]